MGSDRPMLRLFVAILIPDHVRAEIARAQFDLRRALPEGSVSWTRPEQFHLTIKFLGAVDSSRLEPLTGAIKAGCSGFAPLRLKVEGVGFFPVPRRPRVVWAGLEALQGNLAEFYQKTKAAVAGFTHEAPENHFHAHVTIGRVKRASGAELAAMALWSRQYAPRIFGEWDAREAVLMRSQLSPTGAIYTVAASFPFEG